MFSRTICLAFLLLFMLVGCARHNATLSKDAKLFEQEDEYILYAIEYTNQEKYNISRDL